jgi:hypothetical protein
MKTLPITTSFVVESVTVGDPAELDRQIAKQHARIARANRILAFIREPKPVSAGWRAYLASK